MYFFIRNLLDMERKINVSRETVHKVWISSGKVDEKYLIITMNHKNLLLMKNPYYSVLIFLEFVI